MGSPGAQGWATAGSGLSGLPGAPFPGPAPSWHAHKGPVTPLSTSSRELQAPRMQSPELQGGSRGEDTTALAAPHPLFHSKRTAPQPPGGREAALRKARCTRHTGTPRPRSCPPAFGGGFGSTEGRTRLRQAGQQAAPRGVCGRGNPLTRAGRGPAHDFPGPAHGYSGGPWPGRGVTQGRSLPPGSARGRRVGRERWPEGCCRVH